MSHLLMPGRDQPISKWDMGWPCSSRLHGSVIENEIKILAKIEITLLKDRIFFLSVLSLSAPTNRLHKLHGALSSSTYLLTLLSARK